jgi:protein gp37
MGKETGISWTDHTFNGWWGCTKLSPGCAHCYAEAFSRRYKWDVWGPGKPRREFKDDHWNGPVNWNRAAAEKKVPAKVFCGSMMDWAEDEAPAAERAKLFPLIKQTPWLYWLMLTKRPENMPKYLPADWSIENYPNVWLGTSIENNDYVCRATDLIKVPAVVHFVSLEPLLGPVNQLDYTDIEWAIVGGESGSGHRPMDKEWADDIRVDCERLGVAFFYKQSGGAKPGSDPTLGGKEYKNFPVVA